MYVLRTVASAHKCEAPALWFDRQLRVDAWSLPLISACGALGTFRVSVQSHSKPDSWYLHTSPEDLSVRGLPYDAFPTSISSTLQGVNCGKLFPAILATPTRYSTMPDEDDKDLYNGERGPAWRKYRRDMLSTARGKFSTIKTPNPYFRRETWPRRP